MKIRIKLEGAEAAALMQRLVGALNARRQCSAEVATEATAAGEILAYDPPAFGSVVVVDGAGSPRTVEKDTQFGGVWLAYGTGKGCHGSYTSSGETDLAWTYRNGLLRMRGKISTRFAEVVGIPEWALA